MTAAEWHEHRLFTRLLAGLEGLNGVTVHGRAAHRTPTALFSVAGRSPDEIAVQLAAEQINAPAGSFYAIEAAHWIGLGDPGAIRAGLAPYTNEDDVDRLLDAVARTSESTFR